MSAITPADITRRVTTRTSFKVVFTRVVDFLTFGAAIGGALTMVGLLGILIWVITANSWMAIKAQGLSFFVSPSWNPVTGKFGAWPVVYGTLTTAAIALLISVPISVGCAIFLTRVAPRTRGIPRYIALGVACSMAMVFAYYMFLVVFTRIWGEGPAIAALATLAAVASGAAAGYALRKPTTLVAVTSFLIELLAAIPSIAYGLWGAAVLVPYMQEYGNPALDRTLGQLPVVGYLFVDPGYGFSIFAAGIVLAIMVTPIITAITRDVLLTVPPELEQGAIGLGATWWQATKVVLGFARMGIFGAVILGLARALGETMAVTMVVGSTISKESSLLAPGQTIASLLASQFREADTPMFTSALFYTALLLLVITMLINGIARVMLVRVARRGVKR